MKSKSYRLWFCECLRCVCTLSRAQQIESLLASGWLGERHRLSSQKYHKNEQGCAIDLFLLLPFAAVLK